MMIQVYAAPQRCSSLGLGCYVTCETVEMIKITRGQDASGLVRSYKSPDQKGFL